MSRKRRKPAAPEAVLAARRERARAEEHARLRADGIDPDIAQWGDEPVSEDRKAELEAQGVEATFDLRGRMRSAQKRDVFATLKARDGLTDGQYEAIRRLEADMIVRAGFGGSGQTLERYDHQSMAAEVSQRMIEAGVRVEQALALVGPPSCRLLKALIEPSVYGKAFDWKSVVEREAGERRPERQSCAIRVAAQSLMEVYEDLDRATRRPARARTEALT